MRIRKKAALVAYHTKTGHTKQAAEDIARGLESEGVRAVVKSIAELSRDELKDYNLFAIGSPTRNGKPARVVKRFLKNLGKKELKGKTVAGFTAYAGFRGKRTIRKLSGLLKSRGAKKVLKGVAVRAGAPLSLWKGPDAREEDVARLVELGRKLARS
jgi:flavodoxin